jgi:hypothetical protein
MLGVIFNIDFKKEYGEVNHTSLYEMMQAKGLGDIFCAGILACTQTNTSHQFHVIVWLI